MLLDSNPILTHAVRRFLAVGALIAIPALPVLAQSDLFPDESSEVTGAYLAYYARSADPAGHEYWTGRLIEEGGDLSDLIEAFANSPESEARFGDLSDADFIDALYNQLFGRAPEPGGKQYYLDGLASGQFTRATMALDVLFGTQGEDVAVLENKLEASSYFTDRLEETGAVYDSSDSYYSLEDNIQILDGVTAADATVEAANEASDVFMVAFGPEPTSFARIATFPVFLNLGAEEDPASETAAEIVAAAHGGNLLIYTDSPMGRIGFVDITDPAAPQPAGFLALGGEPTSVAVVDDYALVGVNTSESYVAPSGHLAVVDITDIAAPEIVAEVDLGGQPDSVAVDPDGFYAAIAIENERDEDACTAGDGTLIEAAHGDEDACIAAGGDFGGLPQLPAGFLSLVALEGEPSTWTAEAVDLTGIADVAPSDPEPEYVAINEAGLIAVTLQENNHLVVVDMWTSAIVNHFTAGTVDSLTNIDTVENDIIDPVNDLTDLAREPDAVTWISNEAFATANEGDWLGGSRGISIFGIDGAVAYDSAELAEYNATRIGHYPEFRAENKGAEPEGVASARIGPDTYLFTGLERANFTTATTIVEDDEGVTQFLPTGVAPEGLLPIPHRGLFVVAAEEDAAADGIRSLITLFQLAAQPAEYPQIQSSGEPPIGWGALSALAADREDANTLYTVHDSFYAQSRMYTVDVGQTPAVITAETVLLKDGETVHYDLEGLVQRADGSFWAVSEGRAEARENLLIEVAADGAVVREIALPVEIVANATNSGFEGVAVTGADDTEAVYVAVQREWGDDPDGYVKIGRYLPATEAWDFFYYPLDEAPEGAWVGLSEIVTLDDEIGTFAVLERDNQQGPSAEVKRVYQVSLADTLDEGLAYPVFAKTLLRDLLPDLEARNGWTPDKVEGLAVAADGEVYVVSDNDGIEDALGETYFLRLGPVETAFPME